MSASIAGVSLAAGLTGASPSPPAAHKLSTLSASELRTGMQQHFRVNGTLQRLKTQLRGMMLTDLLQQPKTAHMLVSGASQSIPPTGQGKLEDKTAGVQRSPTEGLVTMDEPAGGRAIEAVSRRSDHTPQTWSGSLADALVENHLRRTRRAMSLSIFSTEAEVPPFSTSGSPSEEEQYLAHLFRQTSTDRSPANPPSPEAEDDFLTPSPAHSVKSVLQRLVEDCITKQGLFNGTVNTARHLHSCSTQTDAADSTDSATNPLNSLECRLAAVDAKYALTFAQLKRTGATTTGEQPFFLRSEVERRLAQYKNDVHAQLRSEYEHKYNTFTRVQLQEARDEAEQRYRLLVRNKTEELAEVERSVLVKLEQERARLKLSWEDVSRQRLEMERRQRDTMKQLAEYEAAQQIKDAELHKMTETCRTLRLQCAKWEELCATRLMELDGARSREERRLEDIRRLQAEHASELRLKDEEMSRLRYRLRLLSHEVQIPTSTTPPVACEEGASKPRNGEAPIDSKQLYGLLLRTEELQRNAVVQQQQQQQRWDAAWVASAAMKPTAETSADGAKMSVLAAAPNANAASPYTWALPAGRSSPVAAENVAPDVPSQTTPELPTSAAVSSPSAVEEVKKTSEVVPGAVPVSVATAAAAAQPTSVSPPSPPTPAPIATAPQSAVSLQTSTSTSRTSATTTATSSAKTSRSKESLNASSPSSTDALPSPKAMSAAASLSATLRKKPDEEKTTTQRSAVNTVALQETVAAETASRSKIVADEGTARAGVEWSEKNKRDIVEETLRQAKRNGSNDDDSNSGGGITRPWERLGMGGGAQPAAPAVGGGTVFDDSFSTDDDALIRSSSEDDSEF